MLSYGTPAQSKLLTFSHTMLEHVQKKDLGEVGEIISDLMKKLNEVSPDELKPEKRNLFLVNYLVSFQVLFKKCCQNIKKQGRKLIELVSKLEPSKNGLLSDINVLEKLYEANKDYFHALNIYIAAGEIKLRNCIKKPFLS